MTVFISKETINRLLKDVKDIIKTPLNSEGIYYHHDDSDMLKGYAMIVGPSDTPYFGGFYFFELDYPANYPHSPPKVTYHTNALNIRFNPNLYKCGKVCISLLNTWQGEQWSSCQTIRSILLILCTLLCNDPLMNEPGVIKPTYTPQINAYNQIIEYANMEIAICYIVQKHPIIFKSFFDFFYEYVKEHFNKNYDALLSFAEKKLLENKNIPITIKCNFYNSVKKIDYNELIQELKKTNSRIIVDEKINGDS